MKLIKIQIIAIIFLIMLILIAVVWGNKNDDEIGDEHSGTEYLTVTQDFVTEYNRVSGESVTIEELRDEGRQGIKKYEQTIKENTGYEMSYNNSYCDFDIDLYKYYYTSKADIKCYYGNDEGAIYFDKNQSDLKKSYDIISSYYDYDTVLNYTTSANDAIDSTDSMYWKLFLILSSHPVLQLEYFDSNVPIAAYPIIDFNIVELNDNNGEVYGKVEYRYLLSDVLNGQGTKEESTILMSASFSYINNNIMFSNNVIIGELNKEFITTTSKDWMEYRNKESEKEGN